MFGSLKNLVFIAASVVALTEASAQRPGNFLRPPGKPVCNKQECIYTTVNKGPAELAEDMRRVVFGQRADLDGYVKPTPSGGQVVFANPDASILDALKAAAVEYDGMAEFHSYPRVAVTVEIFSVENTFMDNLMAQIQVGHKMAEAVSMDRATVSTDGTSVAIAGVLGNLPTSFVKLQLNIGKERGAREMKNHFSLLVPNGSNLSYSKQQILYRDSKSGVGGEKEKIGLSLSGVVNINRLNTDMVRISDLSISYGLPTGDERSLVDAVNTQIASIDVIKGKSYLVSLDELEIDQVRKKNAFIFGGGREKSNSARRLLLLISATPIPPMEY